MKKSKLVKSSARQQALLKVWRNPMYFLAFGFGTGLIKRAPGTWGTCAGIPIYLLIAHTSSMIYLGIISVAFLFGVGICQQVSKELGVDDYPGIVWDEIVGYLVTMYSLPLSLNWILFGFGLFRLLDILKPQPIRWIDRHLHGGWGIMLDDLLAGMVACLLLHIVSWGMK